MGVRKNFNFGVVNKIFEQEDSKIEKNFGKQSVDLLDKQQDVDEVNVAGEMIVTKQIKRIEDSGYKKAFNFKLIPREKIIFHQKNDFPMEDIEKRAESILEIGLIHNLEALYEEEKDIYILESGEKRVKALDMLIEKYGGAYVGDKEATEYKNYLKYVQQFEIEGYPVNVKYFDAREYGIEEGTEKAEEIKNIDSQIRLNKANLDVLVLDSVLIRKKIEEMAELYARRNALVKKENRVNVNKKIGEELHISERQVQKYKTISSLIPELQELFDKKGISINEGANYSKLNAAEQKQLFELLESGEDKVDVNKLYERLKKQQIEIESTQKELKKLEEENRNAAKTIMQEKQKAEKLEAEIRAEYQAKDLADGQYIKELKEKLCSAKKSIKSYEKKNQQLLMEQAAKMAELEQKIAIKEKSSLETPSQITKTALKLDNLLETIQSLVKEYQKTLEDYKEIYADGIGEYPPEQYELQLIQNKSSKRG